MFIKSIIRNTLLPITLILLISCNKEDTNPACNYEAANGSRFFEFQASDGHTFIAWTNDTMVIQKVEAQLALEPAQRNMHINGEILEMPANCDLNKSWSWYFNPEDWDLADISIEVCDGNPQYVEDNLDDFIQIGRYCPWSSTVSKEISTPF